MYIISQYNTIYHIRLIIKVSICLQRYAQFPKNLNTKTPGRPNDDVWKPLNCTWEKFGPLVFDGARKVLPALCRETLIFASLIFLHVVKQTGISTRLS